MCILPLVSDPQVVFAGQQTGWSEETFHTQAYACYAIKKRSLLITCWIDVTSPGNSGSSWYNELVLLS
jgi:hypothetical protein